MAKAKVLVEEDYLHIELSAQHGRVRPSHRGTKATDLRRGLHLIWTLYDRGMIRDPHTGKILKGNIEADLRFPVVQRALQGHWPKRWGGLTKDQLARLASEIDFAHHAVFDHPERLAWAGVEVPRKEWTNWPLTWKHAYGEPKRHAS